MHLKCSSEAGLPEIARQILEAAQGRRIFLFHGEMGAGKTTLIKSICQALGSADEVSSPTFSIINEYDHPQGKIYHFDCYRLKNEAEAFDIGVEEYLYSGQHCLVEWPEMIERLLPETCVDIRITTEEDLSRSFSIEQH